MLTLLRRGWWLFVVQGVAAALFGLLALVWPDRTLQGLVTIFGAFALIDGILSLGSMFGTVALGIAWLPLLVRGLSGIAIGLVSFNYPDITALVLLYIIGIWAVALGLLQILAGVLLRKRLEKEWLPILTGVVSVVFGCWLFASPGEGALAVITLIGLFFMALGALLIAAGFRLRGALERLEQVGRRLSA